MKVGNQTKLTYLWGIWRDAADALEVDGLSTSEEAVLVDEVLHNLALLLPHGDALVLTLVQVIGVDEVGVSDQIGRAVKQVTPKKEK